jgi:hypothetical protein
MKKEGTEEVDIMPLLQSSVYPQLKGFRFNPAITADLKSLFAEIVYIFLYSTPSESAIIPFSIKGIRKTI